MKKPTYTEELLKIIFSWLCFAFVCMGILCCIGILQPTASSRIQDPILMGRFFLAIGSAFLAASLLLGGIAAGKNKLHSQLISHGIRLKGTVESVYLQKDIKYGSQSPYRIQYVYTYRDQIYHQKSCFLWEKPNLTAGDAITVYANDLGQSTVLL